MGETPRRLPRKDGVSARKRGGRSIPSPRLLSPEVLIHPPQKARGEVQAGQEHRPHPSEGPGKGARAPRGWGGHLRWEPSSRCLVDPQPKVYPLGGGHCPEASTGARAGQSGGSEGWGGGAQQKLALPGRVGSPAAATLSRATLNPSPTKTAPEGPPG